MTTMRGTTVARPAATADSAAAAPLPGAIAGPVERLRRPLLLATALSVAAAVLATAMAAVLCTRRAAASATGRRGAPTSTTNVNGGFARLGPNVRAEQRRR